MAVRQSIGVMYGIFDQNPDSIQVIRTVPSLTPTGRITNGGLVTIPISSGEELYRKVSPSQVPELGANDTAQQSKQTKEASTTNSDLVPLGLVALVASIFL